MKYKLHKKHGYNYIIEHGSNEVLLNEDHMSESPEEGLKGNNKIFEIILKGFVEKNSIINQVTDVMNRLLERSDSSISKKIIKQRSEKDAVVQWIILLDLIQGNIHYPEETLIVHLMK